MSLLSALNTARTSLNALRVAMSTLSENIANETNGKYHRHIAQFESRQSGGVQIGEIRRAANLGLLRDLYQQIAASAADDTRNELFNRIDHLIGTSEGKTPLIDDLEKLCSTFKTLEATPESDAAKNDLLLAADSLQKELTRLSDGLDLIENQVLSNIDTTVDNANAAMAEIDRLNARIVAERIAGRPTSNLEDLRDAQVAELAEIAQLRTVENDDGSLSVYTTTGLTLVGSQPETFTWNAASRTLTLSGSPSSNLMTDGRLSDGRLSALISFIRKDSAAITSGNIGDGVLEKFRNQLDELAFSLADDSTARTSGNVFVRGNSDLTASGITTAGGTLIFTVGGAVQGTVTINANDSIDDVIAAINAIPQVRARVDGHGNLQILSDGGAFTIGGTAAADFGLTTSTVPADDGLTFSYAYKMEHAEGSVPLTTGQSLSALTGVANGDQFTINNASMGGAVTIEVAATTDFTATPPQVSTVGDLIAVINRQPGMYARLGPGNVLQITSDDGQLAIAETTNTPLTALGFSVTGTSVRIDGTALSSESNDFFVAESGNTPRDVNRTNFALAPALADRSASVKTSTRAEVVRALNASARGMNGSGVTASAKDYTGLATSIITTLSLNAETASTRAEESEVLRAGLERSLRDEVGVDKDEELQMMDVLEKSWKATVRVMDAINQMFESLERMMAR